MAKSLQKGDIVSNNTIRPWHVTQSVDAFTGIDDYDIKISGSLTLTGSLQITGSANIKGSVSASSFTGSFTGSLKGTATTASYVVTAQTASYVVTAQTASYIQNAQTASYIQNAQTASYVVTAQTASYVVSSSYALSSSYAVSSSYVVSSSHAITSSFVNPLNQNVLITGSLTTSGSRVRNFRTITITDADYNTSPTEDIKSADDIILIIDNTTTSPVLGEGNLNVTSFLNSPAGRCVEIVNVKIGSGNGLILKNVTMAGGIRINNTNNINGIYDACDTLGSSITLMSMGLASTGSIWGTGV